MFQTMTKVSVATIEVDDRPGMLAEVSNALHSAGVDIRAMAGWSLGAGRAALMCVPDDIEATRRLAAGFGVTIKESELLMVTGDDVGGALSPLLGKVAAAGINIKSFHGIAVDGKYGVLIGFTGVSVDDALSAIGA